MANRVINNRVTKDLGPVTAYGIAKANGYSGTRQQFTEAILNAAGFVVTAPNGTKYRITVTNDGKLQTEAV